MTQEGLTKIELELEHLKHVRRPEVAERIRQSKELASTQNNA
ncbi:MAG: transcription elongation factor GreA, partial [Dehalococcoidia bacterium]